MDLARRRGDRRSDPAHSQPPDLPADPSFACPPRSGRHRNGEPEAALRSLLGGLAAFSTLFALAILSPGGMGMGDVKLAAFIGIGLGYLGWDHVVLGVFGSFALGGTVAIALLATGLRTRRDFVPFGPYLAAAALLTVLFGRHFINAYLQLSGLN